jgi:hypothetical protein
MLLTATTIPKRIKMIENSGRVNSAGSVVVMSSLMRSDWSGLARDADVYIGIDKKASARMQLRRCDCELPGVML